jgi:hypothetical protein
MAKLASCFGIRVACLPVLLVVSVPAMKHAAVVGSIYELDNVEWSSPATEYEGWMVSGQETVFCWVPVP